MRDSQKELYNSVPSVLAELDQWHLWRLHNGTKLPFQICGNKNAKSNDPETWSSLDDAVDALDDESIAARGFQLAFELATCGLVGLDLDDCRDPETGDVLPWADDLLNRIREFAYIEVSPSGTGYKALIHGEKPAGMRSRFKYEEGGMLEVFDHGRFWAWSGDVVVNNLPELRDDETDDQCHWVLSGIMSEHARENAPERPQEAVSERSALNTTSNAYERAAAYVGRMEAFNGERNNTLLMVVQHARSFQLDPSEVSRLALEWNANLAEPLDVEEVARTVDSAYRLEPFEPKEDRPDPNAPLSVDAVRSALEEEKEEKKKKKKKRIKIKSYKEIQETPPPEYIIDGLLVKGQPCVLAGPSKSLKTQFAIAMAHALGSGQNLFGKFNIKRPYRTLLMSRESGDWVMKNIGRLTTLANSKRVGSDEIPEQVEADLQEHLIMSEDLPHAKDPELLDEVEEIIKDYGLEVLILDPLYSCVDGEDSGNLTAMAEQFRALYEVGLRHNCEVVFVHHSKKNAPNVVAHNPLELSDITGAGCAEYFGQFILLNRAERYMEGSGYHLIHVGASNRYGGGSYHCWEVNETLGADNHVSDWGCSMLTRMEVELQQKAKQEEKSIARDMQGIDDGCKKIVGKLQSCDKEYLSISALGKTAGKYQQDCLDRLESNGVIEIREEDYRGQTTKRVYLVSGNDCSATKQTGQDA